jgi:hypothetical protein
MMSKKRKDDLAKGIYLRCLQAIKVEEGRTLDEFVTATPAVSENTPYSDGTAGLYCRKRGLLH